MTDIGTDDPNIKMVGSVLENAGWLTHWTGIETFCISLLTAGALLFFALRADTGKERSRNSAYARYLLAVIPAYCVFVIACWIASSYLFRIVQIVPENPMLIETAIQLGQAGLYRDRALLAQDTSPADKNIRVCISILSQIVEYEKSGCNDAEACAKFANGERLDKRELLDLLAFMQKNTRNQAVESGCKDVDFNRL